MAKFLTDSDFAEIRETINDAVETFAQKTVKYKLSPSETLSRFNRDRQNTTGKTEKVLLGLVVWNDADSELKVDEHGKYDFSMGYVIFSWDYLDAEGLIATVDNNGVLERQPIFKPEADFLGIDGEQLQVMGIYIGGQLKDTEAIVKVYFKRDLKNG